MASGARTGESSASGSHFVPSTTNLSISGVESAGRRNETFDQSTILIPGERSEYDEEPERFGLKNILTFDGGGIRGYYSLLILKKLMKQIKWEEENFKDQNGRLQPVHSSFHPCAQPDNISHNASGPQNHFLPCHYFDYICGTSTGALISVMLSRLRMPVDDCLSEYRNLGTTIFGKPRWIHQTRPPIPGITRTKYNTQDLEHAIQDVTKRRGEVDHDEIHSYFRTEKHLCRTFVLAYKKPRDGPRAAVVETPWAFRSYDHFRRDPITGSDNRRSQVYPRNAGRASRFCNWEVGRAATAAPIYFDPMIPNGTTERRVGTFTFSRPQASPHDTFIDGGFGLGNNPAFEALMEVEKYGDKIATFVSIGTGRKKVDRFGRSLISRIKNTFAAVGDPELAHQDMEGRARDFEYYRFNQPDALGIEFDEWKPSSNGSKTIRKIEDAYHITMDEPGIFEQIKACAKELVQRRRLRAENLSVWEQYSVGAYFTCSIPRCSTTGDKKFSRDKFSRHLQDFHPGIEDHDRIIAEQMDFWRYKPPASRHTLGPTARAMIFRGSRNTSRVFQ